MKITSAMKLAGAFLALAAVWAIVWAQRTGSPPETMAQGTREAARPANPCNPCAAKVANPCNPCAAKAANPCNPCAARPANPCNPCAAKIANPCNPCAAKVANPCNPCAARPANPCNPCAAKAANPCNPGQSNAANPCNPAASRSTAGDGSGKIGWGREFKSWDAVTGYVISNSHGNRLVQTYIYPPEAAKVYKRNAELARLRKTDGYQPFPPGTRIVQESWLRNDLGGPGAPGPVFFMRKEDTGYDSSGGDWHYAFTRDDLTLIGEGQDAKLSFCKECHTRADRRDFVYATER